LRLGKATALRGWSLSQTQLPRLTFRAAGGGCWTIREAGTHGSNLKKQSHLRFDSRRCREAPPSHGLAGQGGGLVPQRHRLLMQVHDLPLEALHPFDPIIRETFATNATGDRCIATARMGTLQQKPDLGHRIHTAISSLPDFG
jgi:hypothetical protein